MSLIRIALGLFFCLLGVLVQNRSWGNNLYHYIFGSQIWMFGAVLLIGVTPA